MNKLRDIIENNTSFQGKVFDYFIQSLIILSLIALSIETLPNLSDENLNILKSFELFCIIIFSIEYLLRIIV